MRTVLIGALTLATAFSPPQVETADLMGRWTWEGYDCARTNLEIGRREIILTAENGERGPLFRVHEGPHRTENPDEYILHVELVPHWSMTEAHHAALQAGQGRHALLLKVAGDRIDPIMLADDGGARMLDDRDHSFGLFSLRRCA